MSHLTYVRQKSRDHGVPLDELTLEVTDHDRERAEDTVAELERLGVYRESAVGELPEGREPLDAGASPETESKRQPVTDLWGNPINKRKPKRTDTGGGFLRRRSGQ